MQGWFLAFFHLLMEATLSFTRFPQPEILFEFQFFVFSAFRISSISVLDDF